MDGLLTFLFYAVLFYFFMRFGCGAHMTHGHHHGKDNESSEKEVFVDPVCGENVPED